MLGARVDGELEPVDELLAEVPAASFREDRVLGVQFVARFEGGLGFAIGSDAHVRGGHAFDASVVPVEDLRGGESREDVDA